MIHFRIRYGTGKQTKWNIPEGGLGLHNYG